MMNDSNKELATRIAAQRADGEASRLAAAGHLDRALLKLMTARALFLDLGSEAKVDEIDITMASWRNLMG